MNSLFYWLLILLGLHLSILRGAHRQIKVLWIELYILMISVNLDLLSR